MSRVRGNSVSIARKKILQRIENFEYLSGDIVSDLELSKQFNMSRTPIREAIMSLINEGILERTQTRIVVKPITLTNIIQILEVRDAIEQKSAEIIIQKNLLKPDQIRNLVEIHENLQKNIMSANFDKNFEQDNKFHERIIEYSGNEYLLKINHQLSLQSKRLMWISLLSPNRYNETIKEHKNIMDSILSCDLDKAKQSIHQHILNTKVNYEQILNNSQWDKIAHEIKCIKGNIII